MKYDKVVYKPYLFDLIYAKSRVNTDYSTEHLTRNTLSEMNC